MPFSPNSLSCPTKLSSEYKLYACGNFSGHSLILEKIAILGQPPSVISLRLKLTSHGFDHTEEPPHLSKL